MSRKPPKSPRPTPHEYRDDIVFKSLKGETAFLLGINHPEHKGRGRPPSPETTNRLRDALEFHAWAATVIIEELAALRCNEVDAGFDAGNLVASAIGDEKLNTSADWGRRYVKDWHCTQEADRFRKKYVNGLYAPFLDQRNESSSFDEITNQLLERLKILKRALRRAEDYDQVRSTVATLESSDDLFGKIGYPGDIDALSLAFDANIQPDDLWFDHHYLYEYFWIARFLGELDRFRVLPIDYESAKILLAFKAGKNMSIAAGGNLSPDATLKLLEYFDDLIDIDYLKSNYENRPSDASASFEITAKGWEYLLCN